MYDSSIAYWKAYISKLSPFALIASLSLVNKCLDFDFDTDIIEFDQLSELLLDEVSFRYHKIVYDCAESGTLSLDLSTMVSEVVSD